MHSPDRSPCMIFFDVGETLIRPRKPFGDFLREIADETGVDVPETAFTGLAGHIDGRVVERTLRGLPFTFPREVSQQFWFETYSGFMGQFLAPLDAERLTHRLLGLMSSPEGYELYPDTRVTLDRLRRRGYRLGVISNWEAWLPRLLTALEITDAFDHVVLSGTCGFEKPDGRIFDEALRVSGCRPADVVYVGDRPAHDVEPALALGITPILLDRNAHYPQDDRYISITSLQDLIVALEDVMGWLTSPASVDTGKTRGITT